MKEKWYGTPFTKVKIADDFLAKLRTILPSPTEKIGYPPENLFIPTKLDIKKRPRILDQEEPTLPSRICSSPLVWFKQDDTFEQPFTFCDIKIETTDLLYP